MTTSHAMPSATELLPMLPELVLIDSAFALLIIDLFIGERHKVWTHFLSVLALVGLDPAEMGWQDGLSTWVEEGGASLSGGQRRRLSIARALLKEAPITLLDEPSEGLDLASERELVRRVTAHLRGRTLLWVSHREDLNHTFDRMIRIPA